MVIKAKGLDGGAICIVIILKDLEMAIYCDRQMVIRGKDLASLWEALRSWRLGFRDGIPRIRCTLEVYCFVSSGRLLFS